MWRLGYDIQRRSACAIPFRDTAVTKTSVFLRLADRVADVEGNFVECGVAAGRSLLILLSIVKHSESHKQRTVWGFDSFQGFPDPSPEDANDSSQKNLAFFRHGRYGYVGIRKQLVIENLLAAGFSEGFLKSSLRLVEGFFKQSLETYDGSPIALLHVDVDLYESYKDVLTTLYPLLSVGGVVVFDEYRSDKFPGAQKAIDEYFGSDSWRISADPFSGQYNFVKER